MDFKLFGFSLKRKSGDNEQIPSVVSPASVDGAIVLGADGAAAYGVAYDPLGAIKNENDLIRRYREVAAYPEVDSAVSDIVDEAIVSDQDDAPVKLQLDQLKVPDNFKKKMQDCMSELLDLLEFNDRGHDIFKQWYVDGKVYYHVLFENNNTKNGIAEVRLVDPRKIKKIKNIKKGKTQQGVEVVTEIEEYYLYNDKGITESNGQGVKLSPDSIVLCTSGLVDSLNGMTLSHLQKAIKPANQLKMIEDSVVIYRLTRAPERRIFYVDVGNLPKGKAEQYVTDIMNKFKNKLVYDAQTGEIADSKRHMSMMEDFWMPRREGGKGTEITTLPGGTGLAQLDDLEYFKDKLYRSLNVPISRAKPEQGFTLGKSNEISRDEIKFNKFVTRLRNKFSTLFLDLLKIQLIAKGLVTLDEWENIKSKIRFDYQRDNHFTEMKETEIIRNRVETLTMLDQFSGKYYSKNWIQKNVLMMDDEEIKEVDSQIKEEGNDANPVVMGMPTVDASGERFDQAAQMMAEPPAPVK